MRIHLRISRSKEIVPFNYQTILTGALHKWIGSNYLHDDRLSLYSFSWFSGGTALKQGLSFENGAHFFISAHDQQLVKKIIQGVRENPEIAFGLAVNELIIQEDPKFEYEQMFTAASPIFIKRSIDGKERHYEYHEKESSILLTETLQNKLRKANLDEKGVSVRFNLDYSSPRTKVIYYNRIGNKANICPVIIKGTPEQILFAWNVGLGNSTGIGFGAIK